MSKKETEDETLSKLRRAGIKIHGNDAIGSLYKTDASSPDPDWTLRTQTVHITREEIEEGMEGFCKRLWENKQIASQLPPLCSKEAALGNFSTAYRLAIEAGWTQEELLLAMPRAGSEALGLLKDISASLHNIVGHLAYMRDEIHYSRQDR